MPLVTFRGWLFVVSCVRCVILKVGLLKGANSRFLFHSCSDPYVCYFLHECRTSLKHAACCLVYQSASTYGKMCLTGREPKDVKEFAAAILTDVVDACVT